MWYFARKLALLLENLVFRKNYLMKIFFIHHYFGQNLLNLQQILISTNYRGIYIKHLQQINSNFIEMPTLVISQKNKTLSPLNLSLYHSVKSQDKFSTKLYMDPLNYHKVDYLQNQIWISVKYQS